MAKVKARIGVELTFEDNTSVKINEGDILRGLTYKNAQKDVVVMDEGAVRVICANTKSQSAGPTDCPPEPYLHKYITPTMFVMDSSDENHAILTRINIADIIAVDKVVDLSDKVSEDAIVVGPGPEYQSLDKIIENAEDGAIIQLLPGEYSAPLQINKTLNLIGEKGVNLTGAISIGHVYANESEVTTKPVDPDMERISVQFNGITFSGDAIIKTGAEVETLVITECTFRDHVMPEKKSKQIYVSPYVRSDCLVIIEDNVFEAEPENSYNVIECFGPLLDGSSISNNEFKKGCGSNNLICVYGIADDAEVKICDNHADYAGNLIRIGCRGIPKGTIYMERNSYDDTDMSHDGKYAGLFIVQPYKDKTETFANLTIHVVDTTYPAGTQLGYIYASGSDTPWTEDNKPAIYVDGQLIEIPNASA